MESFEMPENHVCSCSEGRKYDKKSEVCKKCVSASKAIDMFFKNVIDYGSPKMVSTLLFYMLAAKVEKEKDKKEEDFKNE